MSKILVYFGHEKPLSNLISYEALNLLIPDSALKLLNNMDSNKYTYISNKIDFQSSWSPIDKETFYNHLLIKNFMNKRNKSLNVFLLDKFLGPYKFRKPSIFFKSLKYFLRMIAQINFKSLAKSYSKNAETLLSQLRLNERITAEDRQTFIRILEQNSISKVLIISTLSDPSIFDLVRVCHNSGIACFLLPDCWDNISTTYAIPDDFTKIFLWSEQQRKDINQFFPSLREKIEIIGSYRINLEVSRISYKQRLDSLKQHQFNILYLEGYFFENRINVINFLVKAIDMVKEFKGVEIKITYRPYPLKKQTIGDSVINKPINFNAFKANANIRIMSSLNTKLSQDLQSSDLIISELSTAGLEAAFKAIPVIFIASTNSPKRLDSNKSYEFTYAKDLYNYFNVVHLEEDNSIEVLYQYLQKIFILKKHLDYDPLVIDKIFSDLEYLAKPFDFPKWSNLIKGQ
jgi:hypothetical protein